MVCHILQITPHHAHFEQQSCHSQFHNELESDVCDLNMSQIFYIIHKNKNVKQPLYRSCGFQEVEVPRFQDNRHMKVVPPPPLPFFICVRD